MKTISMPGFTAESSLGSVEQDSNIYVTNLTSSVVRKAEIIPQLLPTDGGTTDGGIPCYCWQCRPNVICCIC